jgi:hypothetical protein
MSPGQMPAMGSSCPRGPSSQTILFYYVISAYLTVSLLSHTEDKNLVKYNSYLNPQDLSA